MKPSEHYMSALNHSATSPLQKGPLENTEKLKITGRPGDPGLELKPLRWGHRGSHAERALPTLPHTGRCPAPRTPSCCHTTTSQDVPHCLQAPHAESGRWTAGWNHDARQWWSPESEVHGVMGSQDPWGGDTGFLGLLTESLQTGWHLKQRKFSLDSSGSQQAKKLFPSGVLGEKPFRLSAGFWRLRGNP